MKHNFKKIISVILIIIALCSVLLPIAFAYDIKDIIVPDSLTIKVGDTVKLDLVDENANITWSSTNDSIAAVDENGIVTGNKVGSVNIIAQTENDFVDACFVTVEDDPNKLTIEKASFVTNNLLVRYDGVNTVEHQVPLIFTVPNAGFYANYIIESSDPDIIEIRGEYVPRLGYTNHFYKAKSLGKATITATFPDGFKTSMTLIAIPGDEYEQYYSETNRTITLSDKNLWMTVGETEKIVATVPEGTNPLLSNFAWCSSNCDIAFVDYDGNVTATGVGTAEVEVGYSYRHLTRITGATVVVMPCEVAKIEIFELPQKTAYAVGDALDTAGMKLKVFYTDGTSEVVSEGFVCDTQTLDKAGEQTVTVRYSDSTCAFTVSVKADSSTQQIERASFVMDNCLVGREGTLVPLLNTTPHNAFLSHYTVTSSNPEIIEIKSEYSEEFDVTNHFAYPHKLGTVTLTATFDNGVTAQMTMTSIDADTYSTLWNQIPDKTTVSEKYKYLTVGDSFALSATVTSSNEFYDRIAWLTDNGDIAFVDNHGTVTAISKGITEIRAQAGNRHFERANDVCKVIVLPCEVERIELLSAPYITEYIVGSTLDTAGMKLNVFYTDGTSEVVSEGFVCDTQTLDKAGEQTVTVRYSDSTCAFTVKVEGESRPVKVTGITLPKEITIYAKDVEVLIPEITPNNAANRRVIWESSNPSVATVDRYGTVTAVARGSAVITATTDDGAYTASCKVTVKRHWWEWILIIFFFGWVYM